MSKSRLRFEVETARRCGAWDSFPVAEDPGDMPDRPLWSGVLTDAIGFRRWRQLQPARSVAEFSWDYYHLGLPPIKVLGGGMTARGEMLSSVTAPSFLAGCRCPCRRGRRC